MKDHDVVLYGNDSAALTRCVVPFIAAGLQDGGAAVVIASASHERAFRSALAAVTVDTSSESVRERLVFLNASQTLRHLGINGHVDHSRFSRVVGSVIRKLSSRYNVHAYGEMVGLLRASGKSRSAVQLEQLWNELLNEVPMRLLCGYPIDVLGSEFHPAEMDVILTSHTKLLSALPSFDIPLELGIESTLGPQRAAAMRELIEGASRPGWAALPEPESTLLWLRENLRDEAEEIIDSARARFGQ